MKKIACLSGYVGKEKKDSGKLPALVWFSLHLHFKVCSHHQLKVAASFQPIPGYWKTNLIWDQCQAQVLWFLACATEVPVCRYKPEICPAKRQDFDNTILTTAFSYISIIYFIPWPIIFPCIKNRLNNTSGCFGKLDSLFHILNDQAYPLLCGIQIM